MKWAFVDYENTGSLECVRLGDYERVLVFIGPNNSKLKLGTLPSDSFGKLELFGLNSKGNNNLDFHLSFYLGRFHETADKGIQFHIFTADKGYDGLLGHMRKLGRKCQRQNPADPAAPKPQAKTLPPPASSTPIFEDIVASLQLTPKVSRPQKRKTLLTWVKNQCESRKVKVAPELIVEELFVKSRVSEEKGRLAYSFEKADKAVAASPPDTASGIKEPVASYLVNHPVQPELDIPIERSKELENRNIGI